MERRKNEKRTSGRVVSRGGERSGGTSGRSLVEEEEDYGDYVTRCICEFKHDDGYMICCDECSVWQHIECMQVDPKNLPENYLCELCEPRPVDKRRAQRIQLKKREDISDAEESNKRRRIRSPPPRTPLASSTENKKVSSSTPSSISSVKKRKKRGKLVLPDPKAEAVRKSRRDKPESSGQQKKQRRQSQSQGGKGGQLSHASSIQSLLTAASLLEEEIDVDKQNEQLWNADTSPWTDSYKAASENLYTEPVEEFLNERREELKSEAVVYTSEEYRTSVVRQHPQCYLADVMPRRKGLVVQEAVPQDELVIECKGTVAMKQDILHELNLGSRMSLWKYKPCPFVYIYDKIVNLDLCIDSRTYGNLSRYIRRSCCPNAEVRHFFVSDELHFGVYALNHIASEEEVTLPFDFRYDKCDYAVECGCGQSRAVCLVATNKHPAARGGGVVIEDDSQRNQNLTLQRSHSHVFDEDSNSSWTSTGSRKRTRPHPSSPLKCHASSRDGSSDSEEETEKCRKSLSREERKTEQVWRVFEKMEASAQRKRQHLLSEGSHDSDHLSSPPLHPLGGGRGQKDRRSSSSSRKAQMLSKIHLSSVSSADPLSPFDPSSAELFSPPATPGLAPPPECHSPLLSPTSPLMHFQAAPQLHPKYLFADFALPWKKAILRQWEDEQVNGHDSNPRSYWASNYTFSDQQVTMEMKRPRVRGCLKHRWLKHYQETVGAAKNTQEYTGAGIVADDITENKENANHEAKLSYKKRVLLKWQEGSKVTYQPVPSSDAVSEDIVSPSSSPADLLDGPGKEAALFDEFSDSEEFPAPSLLSSLAQPPISKNPPTFDYPHADQGTTARPLSPTTTLTSAEDQSPASKTALDEEEDAKNLSGVSDISMESVDPKAPEAPPPSDQAPAGTAAALSDISSDNMEGSPLPETENKPVPTETSTNASDYPPKTTTAEASVSGPVVVLTSDPSLEQLTKAKPPPLDSLGGGAGLIAPQSPQSVQATPTKTPGKRKINLSEYRNRARKPAERKSSAEKEKNSPPPTTPGTPSYLSSHSMFASSLSPYSSTSLHSATPAINTSSPAPLLGGGVAAVGGDSLVAPPPPTVGGVLHYEQVSPDDNNTPEHVPKLSSVREAESGVAAGILANPAATQMVGGGNAPGGVVSTPAYSMPASNVLFGAGPYTGPLQTGPHPLPGYMLEGGGARWVGDPTQDPRNRPTVPISSSGLIPIPGMPVAVMQQPQGQSSGTLYPAPQNYFPVQQRPPVSGPGSVCRPHPPGPGGSHYY